MQLHRRRALVVGAAALADTPLRRPCADRGQTAANRLSFVGDRRFRGRAAGAETDPRGAQAARLDRGWKPRHRVALGEREDRRSARACRGAGAQQGRDHRGPDEPSHSGGDEGHPDHSDRHAQREFSGREWLRSKPRAPGRQCHRHVLLGIDRNLCKALSDPQGTGATHRSRRCAVECERWAEARWIWPSWRCTSEPQTSSA